MRRQGARFHHCPKPTIQHEGAEVQSDIRHLSFPFKVINKTGKPYIPIEYKGENREFVSFGILLELARSLIICRMLILFLVSRRNLVHGPP